MTKEEFVSLEVGDVVRYGLENYEVIEISKDITRIKNSANSVGFFINKSDLRSSTKYYSSFSTCNNYPISFCLNECSIVWKATEENKLKKQIEQKKTELIQLEHSLKELKEKEQKKELEEQLSKIIKGDFYTIKNDIGSAFTGKYIGSNADKSHTFDLLTNIYTVSQRHIKQIIHRPNFSNEYRILLKKIDTFNSDLENA